MSASTPIQHVVIIVKENHGFETTFGLPPLNQRVSTTQDMTDCFDFKQQPSPPPPTKPMI
jgi:phospholipase C